MPDLTQADLHGALKSTLSDLAMSVYFGDGLLVQKTVWSLAALVNLANHHTVPDGQIQHCSFPPLKMERKAH